MESKRYFGREPAVINILYTKQQTDYFQIVILGQLRLLNLKARLTIFFQLIGCYNLHNYIILFFQNL